jgi:hypothetical protein
MKRLKRTALFASTLLFVSLFSACDMYSYVTTSAQVRYDNPSWAPPYVQGVRYYYLPDIETYYDLTNQEFVYLNNGQWYYSRTLPAIYADFDLDNCFTVAIDYNTYQPWMHQQYYVSHYPRYYYRDYYDHSNIPYVRGYNENSRSAIYWPENQRNHARKWDNENVKSNRQFKYSESDRRQQNNYQNNNPSTRSPETNRDTRQQPDNKYNNNAQPNRGNNNPTRQPNATDNRQQPNTTNNPRQPNKGDNNATTRPTPSDNGNVNRPDRNDKNSTVMPPRISGFESGSRQQNEVKPDRTNQKTNYYGRTIGQPVKVEKQMRERTPVQKPARTETRSSRDSKEQNDNSRK